MTTYDLLYVNLINAPTDLFFKCYSDNRHGAGHSLCNDILCNSAALCMNCFSSFSKFQTELATRLGKFWFSKFYIIVMRYFLMIITKKACCNKACSKGNESWCIFVFLLCSNSMSISIGASLIPVVSFSSTPLSRNLNIETIH